MVGLLKGETAKSSEKDGTITDLTSTKGKYEKQMGYLLGLFKADKEKSDRMIAEAKLEQAESEKLIKKLTDQISY